MIALVLRIPQHALRGLDERVDMARGGRTDREGDPPEEPGRQPPLEALPGQPPVRRSGVSAPPPPPVDRCIPPPAPPETSSQGRRTNCHIPANSTRGLPGTMTRSAAPVVSFTKRDCCQVWPPAAVRNTPRSTLGAQTWPSAATKTMSGFEGSMTMRLI